jgi:hypothetical protein
MAISCAIWASTRFSAIEIPIQPRPVSPAGMARDHASHFFQGVIATVTFLNLKRAPDSSGSSGYVR